MIWLAVNKNGSESLFYNDSPHRYDGFWIGGITADEIKLPEGTIERMIERKLTWDDEPVKIR